MRGSVFAEQVVPPIALLEVVNQRPLAVRLEGLFHELEMPRVHLVVVLLLLRLEDQIQGDLITLIDDVAMAFDHSSDMKAEHARNRPKVFFRAGDQRVRGIGFVGVSPENDNVGKHVEV